MRRNAGRCELPRLYRQRGITQQQLSERTGISTTQLSSYVAGRRTMSYVTAKLIAGALGVRMEELYSDEGW